MSREEGTKEVTLRIHGHNEIRRIESRCNERLSVRGRFDLRSYHFVPTLHTSTYARTHTEEERREETRILMDIIYERVQIDFRLCVVL